MSIARRSLVALLLLVAIAAPQLATTVQGSDEPDDHHQGEFINIAAITVGLQLGDEGEGVEALQAYLEMGGFLAVDAAIHGAFDQPTEDALEFFQGHHRLRATGTVTEQTLKLLRTPRFDDLPHLDPDDRRSLAYVTGNFWTKTDLTYAFTKFSSDLSQSAQRTAMQQAFGAWAAATPLTFTEVGSTSSTDILISFESGSHGDPCNPESACAFDGPSGVLAHAFYPPPNGGSIAGDAHFDEAETWTLSVPVPAGGIDLKAVAIHEFGHSLGLGHSGVQGAIMYPYYSGATHTLHSDDVAGIQSLYGVNPGGGGGETVDAQIVSLAISPTSTTVGTGVSGSVQVRNNGTQAATIPVSVTGPGGFSYNQTTGSIAAGQSTTVGFTWTPGSAGDSTLTATANLSGDSNSGNNSATSNIVSVSNPPQQTIDAEVVSASASPTSITQNSGNVTISASIRNNGSASAAIPVSVTGPNSWISSTARTLAAGASTTVQFSWSASVVGTHNFTVSTSLSGDSNAANNSRTTNNVTVSSPPASGGGLYIAGVAISATPSGSGHNLQATVSIEPGAAASSAYMYGYWIYPNGQYKFGYGYANGSGQVSLQLATTQTGEHKFHVYRVSKSGYTYNSALNTGNPGSVIVGGGTPPATIDASVNAVTATPAEIVLNSGNVSIVATIGNNGDNAASIPVSISGPNSYGSTQNVSVAAGATGQVTFNWPASVAGNHTFSVSTNLSGDSNANNNQRNSSIVSVTQATTLDAELLSLTPSTSSVEQNGPTVTFSASVRNNSTGNATFNVRLTSVTASVNQVKSITLAANTTQTVQYNWNPTVVGNHTFTAITELAGDSNAVNNSKTTTVNVTSAPPPPPPSGEHVFVKSIYTVKVGASWYVYVFAGATDGTVGSGAKVTGTIRNQSGQSAQHSGTTKAGGYAIMIVPAVGSGTHTFTVNDITYSGYSYSAALDSGNPATLQ